mmetsp:Transcript_48728/g.139885  ORF Transcript_48728/g.139885 Transcript_48728/m.139885 type:complete len:313 (+) Transcript_48728:146-1084(+)
MQPSPGARPWRPPGFSARLRGRPDERRLRRQLQRLRLLCNFHLRSLGQLGRQGAQGRGARCRRHDRRRGQAIHGEGLLARRCLARCESALEPLHTTRCHRRRRGQGGLGAFGIVDVEWSESLRRTAQGAVQQEGGVTQEIHAGREVGKALHAAQALQRLLGLFQAARGRSRRLVDNGRGPGTKLQRQARQTAHLADAGLRRCPGHRRVSRLDAGRLATERSQRGGPTFRGLADAGLRGSPGHRWASRLDTGRFAAERSQKCGPTLRGLADAGFRRSPGHGWASRLDAGRLTAERSQKGGPTLRGLVPEARDV